MLTVWRREPSAKDSRLDCVHVGGRYQVGNYLALVAQVSPTLTQAQYIVLSSLASVYLGKDIRTGAEIAVKIGCADFHLQGSATNTACMRNLLAVQVSLQYVGMARKAHMKLLL
jgi:hypothetical protein